MATTKANAHTDTKTAPALILFGMDETHSPRAAAFTGDQVELATKAAELMQLRAVPVVGPELAKLAAQLPLGRIYASGTRVSCRRSKYAVLRRLQELAPANSGGTEFAHELGFDCRWCIWCSPGITQRRLVRSHCRRQRQRHAVAQMARLSEIAAGYAASSNCRAAQSRASELSTSRRAESKLGPGFSN